MYRLARPGMTCDSLNVATSDEESMEPFQHGMGLETVKVRKLCISRAFPAVYTLNEHNYKIISRTSSHTTRMEHLKNLECS